MAIESTVKKKVIEDWQFAFPQLTKYAQNKLYKLVGPLILGIELMKMPREDDYRPYFVAYSLWGGKMGDDIKACLSGPTILKQFYHPKILQCTIPYIRHDSYFNEVLNSVNMQLPVSLKGNLSLKNVIKMFDDYLQTPPVNSGENTYMQAMIQSEKMKTALYVGVKEANEILNQIIETDWDTKSFKNWNVDIIDWFKTLHQTIADRDSMMKQIEINKEDKKLSKLHFAELIL